MRKTILPIVLTLPLISYPELTNAELSAVEVERLRLCPKNCAAYCEEIPGKPTYCTCFCHAPEPNHPTPWKRPLRKHLLSAVHVTAALNTERALVPFSTDAVLAAVDIVCSVGTNCRARARFPCIVQTL
jgi:hypothetical protein